MAETQAYCFKCRRKTDIKNPEAVVLASDTRAVRGLCADCGTKVYSFRTDIDAEEELWHYSADKNHLPRHPNLRHRRYMASSI
jgi:hypothetical protein